MRKKEINHAFDFLKGIACIGVVFIHFPFPGMFGKYVIWGVSFAVPLFYLIAGYYAFSVPSEIIWKRLWKVLKILLFAIALYYGYEFQFRMRNHILRPWLHNIFQPKNLWQSIVFCYLPHAIPLWYLIAQVETYLFWLGIIKIRKQKAVLWAIPVLFLLRVVLVSVCDTMHLPWQDGYNFLLRALPWFLSGYAIHSHQELILKYCKDSYLVIAAILGLATVILPKVLLLPVQFGSLGHAPYAIALFLLCVRYPHILERNYLTRLGRQLSLPIYIIHSLIGSLLYQDGMSMWMCWLWPLEVLTVSFLLAAVWEWIGIHKKMAAACQNLKQWKNGK